MDLLERGDISSVIGGHGNAHHSHVQKACCLVERGVRGVRHHQLGRRDLRAMDPRPVPRRHHRKEVALCPAARERARGTRRRAKQLEDHRLDVGLELRQARDPWGVELARVSVERRRFLLNLEHLGTRIGPPQAEEAASPRRVLALHRNELILELCPWRTALGESRLVHRVFDQRNSARPAPRINVVCTITFAS